MLNNEDRAQITMMMRVVSLLQENQSMIADNPEMQESVTALKGALGHIFEQITGEEEDALLEQYQKEAEFLGIQKK